MLSTIATSVSSATASGATSMLSMVGGALKKINGVKDPNKLSSHCHTKEKDSVLKYQPTPIHVLKAKSLGRGCEYDPVSNYSASSSRVTLAGSTKRSHNSDALIPAKKSKVDDDEIEAKFSDSDDGGCIDDRRSISSSVTAHVTDSSVPAKSSDVHSLPSSSTNKQTSNVQINDNSSPSKMSSTKLPVSASTTNSAAAPSKPKDPSVNCSSPSESQTNFDVSSNRSDSAQLPSAALKEDNNSAKRPSSKPKAVDHRDNRRTDKDHNSSLGSEGKLRHRNGSNRNSDGDKTLKRKDQHSKADSHHSSDTASGKQNSSDRCKRDRSSSETKSGRISSSKDSCRKSEVASDTHKRFSDKHNTSEQSDKKVAAPNSHSSGQKEEKKKEKEKHASETFAHKHRTTSSGSLTDEKHKTSSHKESKHRQTTDAANGHQEGRSHTESKNVKGIRSTVTGKDSKSSHHKHSKRGESTSVAGDQRKRPVSSSRTESRPSNAVTSTSSAAAADVKFVNVVRNIELFGEDSDTESDLLKSSSAPARVPVEKKESVSDKSSVSWRGSQSSDEVILLPTDDLSAASENDDTFEQCQRLYNELSRQQQTKPATCTGSSAQNVS